MFDLQYNITQYSPMRKEILQQHQPLECHISQELKWSSRPTTYLSDTIETIYASAKVR